MSEVGALPSEWVTDRAVLERVLTRLREWNPEPRRRTQRDDRTEADLPQCGAPQFGASCRRATPADPLIDITMPATGDRSMAGPPPLFRRPVGPTERRP